MRADLYARLARYSYHAAAAGGNTLYHRLFAVEKAGGVEQVYLKAVALIERKRGVDRAFALYLFGGIVRNGSAVGDLAQTVGNARRVKQRFGKSSLARTCVARYRNIFDLCIIVVFQSDSLPHYMDYTAKGRHSYVHNSLKFSTVCIHYISYNHICQ